MNSEMGKAQLRTSILKKPDRWGNNVMITKVEKESNDEEQESLPVSLK